MNALQVGQVVVSNVHTDTEVQTGIASVDNLEVPELQCRETRGHGMSLFTTYCTVLLILLIVFFFCVKQMHHFIYVDLCLGEIC